MSESSKSSPQKLGKGWEKIPEHLSYIEEQTSIRLPSEAFVTALMTVAGEDFLDAALETWDKEKILSAIHDWEYLSLFPPIQEEVFLEAEIIPLNVARSRLDERIKFKGERWVVHKNDVDPFPSNPHAHNYESGLKLHLGNGELYKGTMLVGSINCKSLKTLRSLFLKTAMPALEC